MMGFKVRVLLLNTPAHWSVSKQWWDLKITTEGGGKGGGSVLVNNDGI